MNLNTVTQPLFLCALVGNFILSTLEFAVMPAVYEASQMKMHLQKPLLILLTAAAIITVLLMLSVMGYLVNRTRYSSLIKDFPAHLKDSVGFVIFFLCIAFLYAIICGLLAVAIYAILKNNLQYDTIKDVISIITLMTTLPATPLILAEMLAFSMRRLPVKATIRVGFEVAGRGYGMLLLITTGFLAAGGAFALLLSQVDSLIMQRMLQVVIFTLLGSLGTYVIYRRGMELLGKKGV